MSDQQVGFERRKKILIVDDDKNIHLSVKHVLKPYYDCISAFNPEEGKIQLASNAVNLVILDMSMQVELDGLGFIPQLKEIDKDLDIIILSGNPSREIVQKAVTAGASSWVVKNFSPEQLLFTVDSVFQKRDLLKVTEHQTLDRNRKLKKSPIIGKSKAMAKLIESIEKVKKSKANVLIIGETGTGKELIARHIGAPDGRPFVSIDSATITNSMAESLLFGHEKGAFTGAVATSKGLFEEADGGAVFFDEIANMPLEIQVKLLRVLQEKEITRVGSRKTLSLDFRVIAATNLDLEKLSEEGKFKFDLFQRIGVLPIYVPPLRERKEDIPELLQHFMKVHAVENSPSTFSEQALHALVEYNWPGNVREMSNIAAFLCAMLAGSENIEVEDLPPKIRNAYREKNSVAAAAIPDTKSIENAAESLVNSFELEGEVDFYDYIHKLEGKILSILYQKYKGNISKLSRDIKMSRSHLYSKLNSHGIH